MMIFVPTIYKQTHIVTWDLVLHFFNTQEYNIKYPMQNKLGHMPRWLRKKTDKKKALKHFVCPTNSHAGAPF